MKEEIIIAGFGGQGVLSMGKILAYSGLMVFLNFRKVVRFQKKKTMRIEEEKQDKR